MNEEIQQAQKALDAASKNYVFASFAFAFVMALIRVVRDRSESSRARQVQGAVLCGLLTLTVALGIHGLLVFLNVPPERLGPMLYYASIFLGGVIGNLGSQFTRNFARKVALSAQQRLGVKDANRNK